MCTRVMPQPLQACAERHAAHRAAPGLGDQPNDQTVERGKGWCGETGPEDRQQICQRTRYRAIWKHRRIALTRVNQTPSMLPSLTPQPRIPAAGVSPTIAKQDHEKCETRGVWHLDQEQRRIHHARYAGSIIPNR
jgi:hypothetical protein